MHVLRNYSLKSLICDAYDVKDYQVVGLNWLDSEKYEIIAKTPAGTTQQQARRMLEGLLADRFHLVLHRARKDLPAYALVVSRPLFTNGDNLSSDPGDSC